MHNCWCTTVLPEGPANPFQHVRFRPDREAVVYSYPRALWEGVKVPRQTVLVCHAGGWMARDSNRCGFEADPYRVQQGPGSLCTAVQMCLSQNMVCILYPWTK